MTQSDGAVKVSCRHLWKIFGPHATATLSELQAGDRSKEEVLADSGNVVAVRDVSFDVRQGETFVVMGLSGSGKSTLLRCLIRLIDPTDGAVFMDGKDVAHMSAEELRDLRRHKVSMVFQHFGLLPHRTVLDNVAFGLEVQKVDKAARQARAREVLKLVNLAGWEDHFPGQLSGGMQQRVGLARALAVDPEILLFDEPFSALDPLIRREMQDELISLQAQMHKTLIFITHDFAEAIKLGDHIAIMKDGELVQVGTAQEIVLHPKNDYVAEFTEDVPRAHVLTAGAVMRPIASGETMPGEPVPGEPVQASGHTIPATATLQEILGTVAQAAHALPVVDDTGAIVGTIDGRAVLAALGNGGRAAGVAP